MKKLFCLAAVLFGFFILGIANAKPAQAADLNQEKQLVETLNSKCYQPAKQEYNEKLAALNTFDIEAIDFSQLPEYAEAFADYTDELEELMQNATVTMAGGAKDNFRTLVQVNVDLARCYEQELAAYPEYQTKVQEIISKTQGELQAIENYDFEALLRNSKSVTPTVIVPANSSRVFRLRTYCLDTGRSAPSGGEKYLLAGATDFLNRGLCPILQKTQGGQNIALIQQEVWSNQEAVPIQTAAVTAISQTVPKVKAWGALTIGGVGFMILLILTIAKFASWGPAGKILLPLGTILFLVLGGWGAWQGKDLDWYKQFAKTAKVEIQTVSGKPSLIDAYRQGKVGVQAVSPGTISSLDVRITNFTNQLLELDTACLFFVPQKAAGANIVSGETGAAEPGEETGVEVSGTSPTVASEEAQRLTSAGTTGGGSPLPGQPPSPYDPFEQSKQLAKQNFDKALEKLKNNPTEENLKDTLEELSTCQALGCEGTGDAGDKIADAWQGEVDAATQAYQQNSTPENRGRLERATELGQAVGSNTDAAEKALGY